MPRLTAALALLVLAGPALAQTGTAPPAGQYVQPVAPSQPGPPAQPQASSVPPQPQAAPANAAPRYPEAQPVSPPAPTAGTPGAASSQQVVVNPPAQQQPAAPQGTAPPATAVNPPATAVNPPARTLSEPSAPVVVERETARSPLEIVAIDAAYGALAGALVGVGIALLDQGNNWGRDLTLGAGGGILVGAAVGGVQAYHASNRRGYAMDGLGSPDRDTTSAPARRTVVLSYGGRF